MEMTDVDKTKQSDVIFFLGAGASVDAGVPTTFEYVKEFLNTLAGEERTKSESVITHLKEWLKAQGRNEEVDIELLLETMDRLSKPEEDPLAHDFKDMHNLYREGPPFTGLVDKVKKTIKTRSIVERKRITYFEPLLEFLEEFRSVDIFTTNYDICIELFCEVYQRTYRDGFEAEWKPRVFEDPDVEIRLFKIHGSVTWYQSRTGWFFKSLVQPERGSLRLVTGEEADELMLYPMRKWQYAEPLLDNLQRLKERFTDGTCRFAIVVGYSFRDDHLRQVFWDAARRNRELILILVDPKAREIYEDRLKYYNPAKEIPSHLFGRVVYLSHSSFAQSFPLIRRFVLARVQKGLDLLATASREEKLNGRTRLYPAAATELAYGGFIEMSENILAGKMLFPLSPDQMTGDDYSMPMRAFCRMHDISPLWLLELLYVLSLLHSANQNHDRDHVLFSYYRSIVRFILFRSLQFQIQGNLIHIKLADVAGEPAVPVGDLQKTLLNLDSFTNECQIAFRCAEYELFTKLQHSLWGVRQYVSEWKLGYLAINDYVSLRREFVRGNIPTILSELEAFPTWLSRPDGPTQEKVRVTIIDIEKKLLMHPDCLGEMLESTGEEG